MKQIFPRLYALRGNEGKLEFAITGMTAPEIIHSRADKSRPK